MSAHLPAASGARLAVGGQVRSEHGRLVYQFDPQRRLLGVEHIEVHPRRRGHGSALLSQVLRQFPDAVLTNLTALTYDGEDFFEAFVTRHATPAVLHFDTGAESFNH